MYLKRLAMLLKRLLVCGAIGLVVSCAAAPASGGNAGGSSTGGTSNSSTNDFSVGNTNFQVINVTNVEGTNIAILQDERTNILDFPAAGGITNVEDWEISNLSVANRWLCVTNMTITNESGSKETNRIEFYSFTNSFCFTNELKIKALISNYVAESDGKNQILKGEIQSMKDGSVKIVNDWYTTNQKIYQTTFLSSDLQYFCFTNDAQVVYVRGDIVNNPGNVRMPYSITVKEVLDVQDLSFGQVSQYCDLEGLIEMAGDTLYFSTLWASKSKVSYEILPSSSDYDLLMRHSGFVAKVSGYIAQDSTWAGRIKIKSVSSYSNTTPN